MKKKKGMSMGKRKGERDGATRSLDWDDLQQKKKQIYSNKIMIKNK